MNVRRAAATAALLLLLPATPARADDPPGLSPRARGDLAIQARAILKKHCAGCHDGRSGTVRVLEHKNLIAEGPNPVPFVAPGRVAASQVIQFLEDGSMPPGDRPRPTDDEVKTLKEWINASAPGYPRAFDEPTTLAEIQIDTQQHADDAANLRYVSFAHLVGDDGELGELHKAQFALHQGLLACGIDRKAVEKVMEPVDDTATLFRLDVRTAGWHGRQLFYRTAKDVPDAIHELSPYDLILLEYPHGSARPAGDPLDDYLTSARLDKRRVPFLRGDWLAGALAPGKPLAADLQSLADLGKALRRDGAPPPLRQEKDMPCGPKPRAFGGANPVPAAAKPPAERPVLPLSAWYSGDVQTAAPPFSLTAEAVVNGKPVKSVAKGQKFQLRVEAKQGVHYVLLMVWSNGKVVVQETNSPGFLKAGVTVLTPKPEKDDKEIGFVISDVLTGEKTATEYFVLLASTDPIPTPTIVCSRHSAGAGCREAKEFPIYRFLFDAEGKAEPARKFDPTGVVRRVVAVTVKQPE